MPKIMKLTDVGSSDETVQRYIDDQNYIMQQKFDGTRIMANYTPLTESLIYANDGVNPVGHAAAKLKLPALDEVLLPALREAAGRDFFTGLNVSLEGELLIRTGEFILWDFLSPSYEDLRWVERHDQLQDFYRQFIGHSSLVRLTPTAHLPESKARMWNSIKTNNVEGAVSKRWDSLYVPGVRSKDWVKHKLVKTADLVVLKTARTFKDNGVVKTGNATLAYYDPKNENLIDFTSASLIGKDLSIKEGDVVEVAYLYREPGGSIVQPRITRKRWDADCSSGDKDPRECTLDQFPDYSREVVSYE